MLLASFLLLLPALGCQTVSTSGGRKEALVDLGNGMHQVTSSGLMWQAARSDRIKSYQEALRYAENLELGGYTDWRLPSVDELYDLYLIFDLKQNGSIDLDLKGNYWSGEKDGDGMAGAWEIGEQCDPARQYVETSKGYVRAVRP